MKYAHTCIRVKNLEESVKFYTEALGYRELRRKDYPEDKFTLVFLGLEGDTAELELTYNYDHGPYDLGTGYGHVALISDDLETDHTRLVNLGYDTTELKGLPGEKPHYFFIKDPDGYKVEIIRR